MRQQAFRSIVHLLLTVVGMSGIAGLFLPFTYGTSPVGAAFTDLWRLALPFFLAVLASASSIRWVISGSFSAREQAIAYVVSASMAGVTLSLWFPFKDGPATIQEWVAFVSPVPILALGVYFLIRNSRTGQSRKFNPVMAIQIAYLANAVLCLIAFFGDWQVGAYCVLVAALAFMLQMVVASAPGLQYKTVSLELSLELAKHALSQLSYTPTVLTVLSFRAFAPVRKLPSITLCLHLAPHQRQTLVRGTTVRPRLHRFGNRVNHLPRHAHSETTNAQKLPDLRIACFRGSDLRKCQQTLADLSSQAVKRAPFFLRL